LFQDGETGAARKVKIENDANRGECRQGFEKGIPVAKYPRRKALDLEQEGQRVPDRSIVIDDGQGLSREAKGSI